MIYISNRWAKISVECFGFFIITLLVFLIGKTSKSSIDNTYIVPIVLFLIGGFVAQIVAYKTRDLNSKKKKK